jgi:hypothetical protein
MHPIVQAANILDTSEFEVLKRGYMDWHGSDPESNLIERVFSRYLKEGEPPYWGRHYAKKIIREFEAAHNTAASNNFAMQVWRILRGRTWLEKKPG